MEQKESIVYFDPRDSNLSSLFPRFSDSSHPYKDVDASKFCVCFYDSWF